MEEMKASNEDKWVIWNGCARRAAAFQLHRELLLRDRDFQLISVVFMLMLHPIKITKTAPILALQCDVCKMQRFQGLSITYNGWTAFPLKTVLWLAWWSFLFNHSRSKCDTISSRQLPGAGQQAFTVLYDEVPGQENFINAEYSLAATFSKVWVI